MTLPLAEYPRRQPGYDEIRALALQAEAAGFDSLWVFDHLLFREPGQPSEGIWESWTTLSALAEATSRAELGTLVLCTAFRNPAVLAKMAVTLDAVSNGRLILGLGAGWHRPEFDAFGIPFDRRVSRFEEALRVISTLLREGTLDFEGEHHTVRGGELRPRGVRAGGPPILVGGFRRRMLRLAAEHADLWNGCWYGEPSSLGDTLDRVARACAEAGRDPASLGVTLGVNVVPGAPGTRPPGPALSGSPAEIAKGFAGYLALGVGHLVCNLNPHHAQAQRDLAEALSLYRAEYEPIRERGV
ncbi:LLM class flavin-dependent oxidoreductase [Microtetraspora sp. NBRC 13810]|uniref:LLM class flavin-dependent oxidoreductase n=1 Tax=Microtetraspora sp. NBRC 13810 TaxID=3030990 RepID=UPI002554F4B6|nr:LLM class flavin-dependent oxidoreductase [Microtetraspora sp. NBRC 13810]